MLFDVHVDLIKKMARDVGIGKRDAEIKAVKLGPNEVTYVGAKSEDGLQFVKDLRDGYKLPLIEYSPDDDDEDFDGDDDDDGDDDSE
ncbi:MAG TPA: hypothetical protein VE967_19660 [Gemmatimonadaceae bacterium]|nr:hypothetical protein [Gemmatimonadaceae bacterium]